MVCQVYKERVLDVAVNCAREAARSGVKRFIHVSTAQVYNSDKVHVHVHTLHVRILSAVGPPIGHNTYSTYMYMYIYSHTHVLYIYVYGCVLWEVHA